MSRLLCRRAVWMPLACLALVALALQLALLGRMIQGELTPLVSDLGRDLLGARAVAEGAVPYQRLGELREELPEPWADQWVAHSPLSIAAARGLAALAPTSPELVARWLGLLGLLGLTGVLARRARTRSAAWATAWAVWVWLPTAMDVFWVQTAAVAALAISGILFLDRWGRRNHALALLGLAVAWRPWLLLFAFLLPRSRAAWRDGVAVSGWATAFTLAVLPWTGGWATLAHWLGEALTANSVASRLAYESGYTLTGALPMPWAMGVYFLVVGSAVLGRDRFPRTVWPALAAGIHLVAGPFVWEHYWVAVVPAVLWSEWNREAPLTLRVSITAWLGAPAVLSAVALAVPARLGSLPGWGLWISSAALAWGLLLVALDRAETGDTNRSAPTLVSGDVTPDAVGRGHG